MPMSIMVLRDTLRLTSAPATMVNTTAQRLGMLLTRVMRLYGTSGKVSDMLTSADVHQSAPAAEAFATRHTIIPIRAFVFLSSYPFSSPYHSARGVLVLNSANVENPVPCPSLPNYLSALITLSSTKVITAMTTQATAVKE